MHLKIRLYFQLNSELTIFMCKSLPITYKIFKKVTLCLLLIILESALNVETILIHLRLIQPDNFVGGRTRIRGSIQKEAAVREQCINLSEIVSVPFPFDCEIYKVLSRAH